MCWDSSLLSLSTMRPTLPPESGGAALSSEITRKADHCFKGGTGTKMDAAERTPVMAVMQLWKRPRPTAPGRSRFHRPLMRYSENPLRCLLGTQGFEGTMGGDSPFPISFKSEIGVSNVTLLKSLRLCAFQSRTELHTVDAIGFQTAPKRSV